MRLVQRIYTCPRCKQQTAREGVYLLLWQGKHACSTPGQPGQNREDHDGLAGRGFAESSRSRRARHLSAITSDASTSSGLASSTGTKGDS